MRRARIWSFALTGEIGIYREVLELQPYALLGINLGL